MRQLLYIAGIWSILTLTTFADNTSMNTFTLTTDAFLDKGILPVLYTCDGKDKSPSLTWSNPPAKTVTFALIMSDQDAPGGTFYHWIVYNIPKTVTTFAEGIEKLPSGVVIGKNDFGNEKYNGPCPPKDTTHTYTFTLYALDTALNLPAGAKAQSVLDAMQKHIVGKTEISTAYSRWLS